MATPSQILLASRSPRRQELVRALWPSAELRVLPPPSAEEPGFDDCQTWTEIEARISQIAHLKAEAVRPLWQADPLWSGAWLIAADTTVVVGDEHAGWQVRGQPADGPQWRSEVTRWFRHDYAGRWHSVLSAVEILWPDGTRRSGRCQTRVRFRPDIEPWLEGYLKTGESRGKAGGYALQGAASIFIEQVSGSLSNVVGLPLETLLELTATVGNNPGG